MNTNIKLAAIFLLGLILRVIFIADLPRGFTADEAGQAYDAYSIIKTGKDSWGQTLPVFPRGFGDYKAPLYMYLAVPSIAVFGLNEFATRFPAALLGSFTIIIFYFLGNALFPRSKNESDSSTGVGLVASLLLAISPWHVQLSRIAWEGGIGIFFFSLSLLLFVKGLKKPSLLYLSFFFFGLTTYAYHSWRIVTILFIPILLFFTSHEKLKAKYLVISLGIFLFTLLPTLFNFNLVFKRAGDVSLFSKSSIEGYFRNKGTSSTSPEVARLFDNKFRFVTERFFNNYLSYYSPQFYLSTDRSDSTHLNFPGTPLHYQIEIIFLSIGIYMLIKEKPKFTLLLVSWGLLAPIPAALTESANAQRGIPLLPLTVILSGFGAYYLLRFVQARSENLYKLVLLSLLPFFFVFTFDYFLRLPNRPAPSQLVGFKGAFTKALNAQNEYDRIVFSHAYTNPHILLAFYGRWDPQNFQSYSRNWNYESQGKRYIDQLTSYSLGNFEIHDIDWLVDQKRPGKTLYIGTEENFPKHVQPVWDWENNKAFKLFRFVSVENE